MLAYARVSTDTQTTDNQRQEIEAAGYRIDDWAWFEDRGVSGKTPANERPAWLRLLTCIRPGETVVVTQLDRLGRDASDIVSQVEQLQARGCAVVVLRLGRVDITSAAGRLILQVLAAVAEMERNINAERTRAALAARKREGVKLGAKPKTNEKQRVEIVELLRSGVSISEAARRYSVSRQSIGRIAKAAFGADDWKAHVDATLSEAVKSPTADASAEGPQP